MNILEPYKDVILELRRARNPRISRQMILTTLSRDYNLTVRFIPLMSLDIINIAYMRWKHFYKIMNNLSSRWFSQYNKHNYLWFLECNIALKFMISIIFSLNHYINIKENLLLLFYLLNYHHHYYIFQLNNNLLINIYLYINFLILWWILLTHWISWILYITLFIYLFW